MDEDDPALEDTVKEYGLCAEFTAWPQSTNPTAPKQCPTNNINFGHPCLLPRNFASVPQDDIIDNYSETAVTWTLNKFTIEPEKCKVNYECVDPVVRVDGSSDHTMMCSDFNFDGMFDGLGNDGVGSITAPVSKY